MGWTDEEHPEHEGYPVGYIVREGCAPTSGLYRELGYPADAKARPMARMAAGCDCGWRSPQWIPDPVTDWAPYAVFAVEADDQRVHQLWKRHLEVDVRGAHRGHHGAAKHDMNESELAGQPRS